MLCIREPFPGCDKSAGGTPEALPVGRGRPLRDARVYMKAWNGTVQKLYPGNPASFR